MASPTETQADRERSNKRGTARLLALPRTNKQKTYEQLSPKQKMFIKYMAEGDTQANSCVRAGCTPTSARTIGAQWMKVQSIRDAIELERISYREESKITKRKIMEMHMEAFDMAKLMSEPATMVSAAREMGKLCGYYEPKKVDLTVSVSGQIEHMNKMTDAQLLEIINKGLTPLLEHEESLES